jgi:hypothetical protein
MKISRKVRKLRAKVEAPFVHLHPANIKLVLSLQIALREPQKTVVGEE